MRTIESSPPDSLRFVPDPNHCAHAISTKSFGNPPAVTLLRALDRNAGCPFAIEMGAGDDKVVGKPSGVPSLPINARDAAKFGAEGIGPAKKIEQEARSGRILIAESATAGDLNRRFLLRHSPHPLLADDALTPFSDAAAENRRKAQADIDLKGKISPSGQCPH